MKFEHILDVEIDEPYYIIRKSSMDAIKKEIRRLKDEIEDLEDSRNHYAQMLDMEMESKYSDV